MKTHIYQDGYWLHARVYTVMAGSPEIVTVSVDLRPIAKMVRQYHTELHKAMVSGCVGCSEEEATQRYIEQVSGCVGCDHDTAISGLFDSIANVVKSIGKSKLVKGVAKAVSGAAKAVAKGAKAVVTSKATGFITAAAAAVFPPVGAPALAAYAAANATLGAIQKANQIKNAANKTLNVLKGAKKLNVAVQAKVTSVQKKAAATTAGAIYTRTGSATVAKKAATVAAAKAKPAAVKAIAKQAPKVVAAAKTAVKVQTQVKAIAASPKAKTALLTAAKQGQVAKATVKNIVANAQYATDPAKKAQAQTAAKVVAIVAQQRASLAQTSPSTSATNTGLVVDTSGRITKGKFRQGIAQKGAGHALLVATRGQVIPGYWQRVSGCIGCS